MTATWVCNNCQRPLVTVKRTATTPPGHRVHAAGGLCHSCYGRARRAAANNTPVDRIPRGCTALEGTPCHCYGCALATNDRESPRALTGGTWALNPTTKTREWKPAS